MLDFSFGELLLLAVIALVVLGPEKLPHAARMAGAWIGRIRRSVISIQTEIEREVAAQEMRQRIEQEVQRVKDADVSRQLRQDVADISRQVNDVGSTTREALSTETPPPLMTPLATIPEARVAATAAEPVSEKPGEEAFKAFVQSSKEQSSKELAGKEHPAKEQSGTAQTGQAADKTP